MPDQRLSLFKRSNGIWYVAYHAKDKRAWRSTRCSEKSEALQVLRTLDLAPLPQSPTAMLLSEFIREFLAFAQSSYRKKTCELYEIVCKRFSQLLGPIRLQDITAKTWDDYSVMRSHLVSPTTLNMEQRALKSMMNRAVTWGYRQTSPFAKMKNIQLQNIPPKYFTREEFDGLLALIKEQWFRDVVIFAVCTGIRRGELLNLRWDDVDLTRRVIIIQGRNDFRVKGLKSRIVPLSSAALAIIARQERIPTCPYVFQKNGNKLWPDWITGLFRRYVKKAGLTAKGLHWHSLRSSFASWLVSGGVSLYAVSRLLGHSTVTLTQNRYAHLAPETMHSTVQLIDIAPEVK